MQNEYKDIHSARGPKQPKTVLIVHPNKSLAETLFSFFRALPISAARATTEEEAAYLFGLLRPDLVIAGMPGAWLRLIETFRTAQPSPEIIVLVDSDDLAEKARGMGFENVVLSDESPESLVDTVNHLRRIGVEAPNGRVDAVRADDQVAVGQDVESGERCLEQHPDADFFAFGLQQAQQGKAADRTEAVAVDIDCRVAMDDALDRPLL